MATKHFFQLFFRKVFFVFGGRRNKKKQDEKEHYIHGEKHIPKTDSVQKSESKRTTNGSKGIVWNARIQETSREQSAASMSFAISIKDD
jgi:hypothetical protein